MTIADGRDRMETIERDFISKFRALAPDSGAYLNEVCVNSKFLDAPDRALQANPVDVDWKRDFYGVNYDRLLSIKTKYDPNHIFYGLTAVGSDYWVEKDDKRLCRADTQ